jgi:hypothetical protein
MDAEKINLLAVLDDRVDSLKRMSPAIESEMAKAVQAQATAAALLDEVEALTADAERWRHFACAQTALMLGTKRNPNDPLVDWLIECNELADAARHEPKDAE